MGKEEWQKQVVEMEKVVKEVEGTEEGFREYAASASSKKKQ